MKILTFLLALALSGCATCHEHPVACSIAGVIVATSVAQSFQSRDHAQSPGVSNVAGPNCSTGACR